MTLELLFIWLNEKSYCFSSGQDIKIVYSIRDYIKELDVASGKVTMVAKVSDNVFSMAYDYKHGYLFLPRFNTGDILR